jgi:catechol 2,3-dioxygenase-like lactoylglutathione lyase family enzyme
MAKFAGPTEEIGMIEVKRITHVNINCGDASRQAAFYSNVLGLQAYGGHLGNHDDFLEHMGYPSDDPGSARTDILMARNGRGAAIELIQWRVQGHDRRAGARDLGVARIGLEVADVAAAYTALRADGVDVLGEPQSGGVPGTTVRAFLFRDPEGNILEALEFQR